MMWSDSLQLVRTSLHEGGRESTGVTAASLLAAVRAWVTSRVWVRGGLGFSF